MADDDGAKLVVATCESEFDDCLEHCLKQDMANSHIAYDMAVVFAHRPQFAPLIWEAYRDDRVSDLITREKLIALADQGDLEYLSLPNGAKEKLKWGQAFLEKRILGIDRTADKEDDDAWRTHFAVLDGMPASEYPTEAFQYALGDAVHGHELYVSQENRVKAMPWDVLKPEKLSTRASFALYLSSCWGFAVDHEEVEVLFEKLSAVYHEYAVKEDGEPAYDLLLELGILNPSVPPRPHKGKNHEGKAVEVLGCTPISWEPHVEKLKEMGIKFTKAEKSKYSKKPLGDHVRKVCEYLKIPVPMTDGGESGNKQVKFDKEVQAELAGHDDALDQYIDRQKIAKLVTTELPRMRAGRVHPKYDILKKTGRTSSFGNSQKDKEPAYPAVNIQQIDPRVRHAYIAREGHILCSIDYSAIELVSAAQKCIDLFGESVLGDKINAGMDPHAYLGAVLARELSEGEFQGVQDNDENYKLFKNLEKHKDVSYRDFYGHYRKMAKPVGLGYPGGLGAKTFIALAKTTYYVDFVDIAGGVEEALTLAKKLKQIWMDTFPEMRAYFKWVTSDCVDIDWSGPDDTRFAYMSPHGMVRRNCRYTEIANGCALQTPTAEGAKIALWHLAEAMYDSSNANTLFGCHMVAFIHDEVIIELPFDDLVTARAYEAAGIMVDGMKVVMQDMKVQAEPALMHVWDKRAETVLDDNKQLIPWLPKSAA